MNLFVSRWRFSLLILLLGVAACGNQDSDPTTPPPQPASAPELTSLPEFTPGTSVTLAWSVPAREKEAWQYLVQRSVDGAFETVAEESEWIDATHTVFEDLAHGDRHHFRVRARDAQGILTDWSVTRSSTQDAAGPVVAIAIPDTHRTSLLFDLVLSAEDDMSGLGDLELWYRVDDGELVNHGPVEPGALPFLASGGGRHDLYLRAVDIAGNRIEPEGAPLAVYEAPEPIIIVDRQGEAFDITNAVLRHGIHELYWDHGIGRNTIRPYIDPIMIGPNHFAYPSDDNLEEVCGLPVPEDPRAYKLNDLSSREVANDVVNGVPIAVSY